MASSSGSSASSGGRSGPPPRADPSTRCRSNCLHKKSSQLPVASSQQEAGDLKLFLLTLAELESLTRSLLSVLFPFLDPRIAGQEASFLEPLPQFDVVFHERPRNPEPQRAGLAGDAAAADRGEHVELIGRFGHR